MDARPRHYQAGNYGLLVYNRRQLNINILCLGKSDCPSMRSSICTFSRRIRLEQFPDRLPRDFYSCPWAVSCDLLGFWAVAEVDDCVRLRPGTELVRGGSFGRSY